MNKIKITVLKTLFMKDIVEEYLSDEQKEMGFTGCDKLVEGQEFIIDEPNIPEGFCSWAWADINREVVAIMTGADMPWINRKGCAIACCTDGLRPVIFRIERVST